MKESIRLEDYAGTIVKALPGGLLLNTNGDKFNSMVIGWGNLGTVWGRPAFTAYVRRNRYSKAQIDKTGEFTVSVPLNGPIAEIVKVCGRTSGRDTDKAKQAGLTLEAPEIIHTPGVREYPLTLECKVLYAQEQDLTAIPADIRAAMYPADVDGFHTGANRDPHTAYIGQIVSAYIIRA